MPFLKKEEKEKLYAGHPMKLEEGKWVHDEESARIVIAFGKSRLKDFGRMLSGRIRGDSKEKT
jgi:hypothetical protein